MSTAHSLLLQYLVIALAVLASVGFVLHSQFPAFSRGLRLRCALWLLRAPYGWLRGWGQRIAPADRKADRGCGGCSSCDSKARH